MFLDIIGGRYTIKEIFEDHWEEYLIKHPALPDFVLDHVNKMMACRDPERLGYAKYICPKHPGYFKVVPHSCKS